MRLFSLIKKDLMILFRNRAEIAVLFIMPLAFILPISFALGGGDGYGINRDNHMVLLTVVDYDQGPRAQDLQTAIGESLMLEKELEPGLIQNLRLGSDPDCALPIPQPTPSPLASPAVTATVEGEATAETAAPTPTPTETPQVVTNPICIEKAGRAMLQRSWRTAVLIIPDGFTKNVDSDQPVDVTLLYDPAGDSIQMQQIEGVVKGTTIKLSLQKQVDSGMSQLSDMAALAPESVQNTLSGQTSSQPLPNQQPAMHLEKEFPENFQARPTPDTFQQTIPGYTVMFVFFIITTMTGSVNQERLHGTFRRLLSAPVSRAELLGGKVLASMVVGLAQVFILFLVGALVFGLGLGNDPLAFFLLTIALVTTATTLGLAVSASRNYGGVITAPLILAALIGGCMFPLDLMPSFLRSLSVFVPHSWALTGYQNLMVRGLGLQEVFPQIMALAGFALIFFFIALVRFDFEGN